MQFDGGDPIEVQVSDGEETHTDTVTVTVNPVATEEMTENDDVLPTDEPVEPVLGGGEQTDDEQSAELGKLAALSGVREYPSRIKCASLAWHALKTALTGDDAAVSTE